jgi:hypothetical protein
VIFYGTDLQRIYSNPKLLALACEHAANELLKTPLQETLEFRTELVSVEGYP